MSAGELAPDLGIVEAVWEPMENQTSLTGNDGESETLEIGEPFWSLELTINTMDRAHYDLWSTFLTRRRLHDLSFTLPRTFRRRPRDAGIVSDAGLTVTGLDEAASTLSMGGFGAGRKASFGDMISYRTPAGGYWIGEVQADAVADGSGAIVIPVWPVPRPAHASAAQPRRIDALGEFRLTDRPRRGERNKPDRITIKAEQVIR